MDRVPSCPTSALARPKSVIFAWSFAVSTTLSGFMSLKTMAREWRYSRPARSSADQRVTSGRGRPGRPLRTTRSCREPWEANSMTSTHWGWGRSIWKAQNSRTKHGCRAIFITFRSPYAYFTMRCASNFRLSSSFIAYTVPFVTSPLVCVAFTFSTFPKDPSPSRRISLNSCRLRGGSLGLGLGRRSWRETSGGGSSSGLSAMRERTARWKARWKAPAPAAWRT
mmetsp:Transcript_57726/g.154234  ORF Transcript_57726/g.154234 Transcript_57726/m.154234 type:complete len:224 (-) Transcript_57726:53-724(-)